MNVHQSPCLKFKLETIQNLLKLEIYRPMTEHVLRREYISNVILEEKGVVTTRFILNVH